MLVKNSNEQENFWCGDFNRDYIDRNQQHIFKCTRQYMFKEILTVTGRLNSVIEFGANDGQNLECICQVLPNVELAAIEINKLAADKLQTKLPNAHVDVCSISKYKVTKQFDLSFTRGVLIHINPNELEDVYKKLYESSRQYILIAEYYNPFPQEVCYRGHSNKLFKRDFAGEMMKTYPDLKLLKYGFIYRNDPIFPDDDITWFILEKR